MIHPEVAVGIALGFFLCVTAHEYVQHRLAAKIGDRTPRLMGRLTLDIRRHFDPLGTGIMPGIFIFAALFGSSVIFTFPLFAWGKRHAIGLGGQSGSPRKHILVALSGPAASLGVAMVAGGVLRASVLSGTLAAVVAWVVVVGATMTAVELLPLPGRDGGRALSMYLSPSAAAKFEELAQYEVLFLLGLFLLLSDAVLGLAQIFCGIATGMSC